MTAHYESVPTATLYLDAFGVSAPEAAVLHDLWPRKPGVFVRNAPTPVGAVVDVDAPAPLQLELGHGQFGLVPPWVKSASDAKLRSTKLINARAETVTTSNNFRDTWLAGQRCIVPMMAFFEDDWRSGSATVASHASAGRVPVGRPHRTRSDHSREFGMIQGSTSTPSPEREHVRAVKS